jgi:hypothetical protein
MSGTESRPGMLRAIHNTKILNLLSAHRLMKTVNFVKSHWWIKMYRNLFTKICLTQF